MKISICTGNHQHSLVGWEMIEVKSFGEIERIVKSRSYAAFGEMTNGCKKIDNVRSMATVAMFDIDNDPGEPQLSIKESQDLLSGITYVLVTSRSHQKIKDDKPSVDRFRILVPLNKPLTASKPEYRLEMMMLAENLGLTYFVDYKALRDIARFYYQSPENAQFIVNNTNKAFVIDDIINAAGVELATQERIAKAAKDEIRNRITPTIVSDFNTNEYHKIIDVHAINKLPLDDVYKSYTGNLLVIHGSYLMGKGISEGTSGSRSSFTIFQDGEEWLWHDFKSLESGNVLSFMQHLGFNAYDAAKALEDRFSVTLLVDNLEYYKKIFFDALSNSHNDKVFESEIKKISGANFVKLGKDDLRIADKTFKLSQFGVDKRYVIKWFIERRNRIFTGAVAIK